MNIDHILRTFADCGVEYLLIGGMNFLLRHEPVLTYDIDFWIRDTAENRDRCDTALRALDAAWGATEEDWRSVAAQPGWLVRQGVFCLTSPSGAIDIFRTVTGRLRARRIAGSATMICSPASWPSRPSSDGNPASRLSSALRIGVAGRMRHRHEHPFDWLGIATPGRSGQPRTRPPGASMGPCRSLAGHPGNDWLGRGTGQRQAEYPRGLH